MTRSPFPMCAVVLALFGCGGNSHDSGPVLVSPYGTLLIAPGRESGGDAAVANMIVTRTDLIDRALMVEARELSIPVKRFVTFSLLSYSAKKHQRYFVGQAEFFGSFELREATEGGSVRTWRAVSGEIVDLGRSQSRRKLRLIDVSLVPEIEADAVDTAIVNGDFYVDFPGSEP